MPHSGVGVHLSMRCYQDIKKHGSKLDTLHFHFSNFLMYVFGAGVFCCVALDDFVLGLFLTIVVFTQLEPLSERSRGRSGGGGELDGGGLRTVGVTTATREGVKPERARESVCVRSC